MSNINTLIDKYTNYQQNNSIHPMVNIENIIKSWFKDTSKQYEEILQTSYDKLFQLPYKYYLTPELKLNNDINEGNIYLFTQFYDDDNIERYKELQKTLKLNVANKNIHKIYLLNERLYSDEELDIQSDKIIQVNNQQRLTYKDVFEYVEKEKIEGYIILSNCDIFFDSSILNIKKSNISNEKRVFTLLRHEYKKTSLKESTLFGPFSDSQDTWIFHSNQNIPSKFQHIFDIPLGVPKCNNYIAYLFNLLDYYCHNEPKLIKCYHYHITEHHNYNEDTPNAAQPWIAIIPKIEEDDVPDKNHPFNIIDENINLYTYLCDKIDKNETFIIPRISSIENNFAHIGAIVEQEKKITDEFQTYLSQNDHILKTHRGINVNNIQEIILYSKLYLTCFHNCDLYIDFEPWSDNYAQISGSHYFVNSNFNEKKRVLNSTLDIYNYINTPFPWTLALKGKKILIISSLSKTFKSQLSNLKNMYNKDFFPDCTFTFAESPQTHGDEPSENLNNDLNKFITEFNSNNYEFDIALISAGGWGNIICGFINSQNKSAINIGSSLQLYFGVYGEKWLTQRPDILGIFQNEHWVRPKENERPKGYKEIHNGCYW